MKMSALTGRLAITITLATTLFFASCSKNGESSVQTSQQSLTQATVEADASGEIVYDDVFNNVMGVNSSVGIGGTGVFEKANTDQPGPLEPVTPPCFTVGFEFLAAPDTFPVKVTIDFGTGCTGKDGRVRKGKIITVYSGKMIKPGSVAETSFDNYYVNDIKVEGTHRVENKSSLSMVTFETRVINGKLTHPNGDFINWNRTRTITHVDGWATPWNPTDDSFSIVGNGSGTVQKGGKTASWTSVNIEPLIKRFDCRWIVKGQQAIQRNDGPQGILDFGNGDCDNKATITVNGVSIEITLK
ncbi:hypothetical protein [Flavihumibacter fluvii]|uniref:hypothetical protein n=1 Tax=Flavihumibacter fluvii TaxID=2838157 RepID=UPI001BDF00BA|nr:hypothetical protein [Flavihumibacter fluvii]ULQ51076.1 hypothetical protein KJS93_13380 [Flavihumibacter fluvii]